MPRLLQPLNSPVVNAVFCILRLEDIKMCNCNSFQTNAKDWMQKAVKHPGAFIAYAKANGGIGADGKINPEWASKIASDQSLSSHVRRMASLYLKFMKAHP